jgi:hypothetical protein
LGLPGKPAKHARRKGKGRIVDDVALFPYPVLTGRSVVGLVNVAVEGREAAEEGDADQIFDAFDVLVEVNQGIYILDFTY